MRLCILAEPQQGATYHDLARLARRAEDCGFDGFFRSDHYLSMGTGDGLPGPTDAWTTLAGLAVETSRIRLGCLVNCVTFRQPGPLSIIVAQIDEMSGGRIEMGLGAGWYEPEHRAYGIPFPPVAERFDRMEEQLAIVSGLWATPVGDRFSFTGRHYTLVDAPALPKPVQRPGPPIIIGGYGTRRTPDLAARYAAEFNVAFAPFDTVVAQYDRVARACERVGRAAGGRPPLVLSAGLVVCCGRTDAEVASRASTMNRSVENLRVNDLCGTPPEIAEQLGRYRDAGAQRVFLQVRDIGDLDHLDAIADVLPLLD